MKNFIRIHPLHSLFVGPAIVFFLFAHNYEKVFFTNTFRSSALIILLSIFLFGISWLSLKRNLRAAGAFTTLLILLFFSYGIVYEKAEELFYHGAWPLNHIHRYLVLCILMFIILTFIWLRRTRRTLIKLTKTTNAFVYTLLVFNLVIVISKATQESQKEEEDSELSHLRSVKAAGDSMPDVYYIILDGYASDHTLAAEFGYDRNPLTTFLDSSGFYVAKESRANYLTTSLSLGSSLNMCYWDSTLLSRPFSASPSYRNDVSRYFKQKGYRVVHISSGYSLTRRNFYADDEIILNSINEFERTLLKYTIFRLDDLFGYIHYTTLTEQLRKINSIPDLPGPKFTMIHIVSPHPPYVCGESGEFTPRKKALKTWWEPREDYLDQLKFINLQITGFLRDRLLSRKRQPLILLQSDHGPWIKDDDFEKIYDARSRIYNAWLVPDEIQKKLYDGITPANSFRILFNGLFHDSLPALPDVPAGREDLRKQTQLNLLHEEL